MNGAPGVEPGDDCADAEGDQHDCRDAPTDFQDLAHDLLPSSCSGLRLTV
jgi:hypothetical protein